MPFVDPDKRIPVSKGAVPFRHARAAVSCEVPRADA